MNNREYQLKSIDLQKSTYKCPKCGANVIIPAFNETSICDWCGNRVDKTAKNVYDIALASKLKMFWKRKGENKNEW